MTHACSPALLTNSRTTIKARRSPVRRQARTRLHGGEGGMEGSVCARKTCSCCLAGIVLSTSPALSALWGTDYTYFPDEGNEAPRKQAIQHLRMK